MKALVLVPLVALSLTAQAARAQGRTGLIMGWQNMRAIADKLDRLVIKQKEKMKDHHRGESAARSDSFG